MAVAWELKRSSGSQDETVSALREKLRTWAGRGRGTRCDHCRQPIAADQIEYEVELPVGKRLQTISLHLRCYEEWVLGREPGADRRATADETAP